MSSRRVFTALAALPAVVVAIGAVVGPWLVTRDPGYIVAAPYLDPSTGLPLGTDHAGRDVFARLLAGGRPLVLIPLVAVVATALIGAATGMLAGYRGGAIDAVISRVDGLLLTIPSIMVLLVLLHAWGYQAVTLVVAVVVVGAPLVSRVARAATLQIMRNGYVEQAVMLGEKPGSVLVREILPGIVRPVLADAGTRLAVAISLTAAAGFLGFGPDEPHWGAMVSENVDGIGLTPWGVIAPALCLAILAVSANVAVERLARRLAP